MDEHRNYFRLHNDGEIHARIAGQEIDLLEISPTGALINPAPDLSRRGILEITIHTFTTQVHYELKQTDEHGTVLVFQDISEVESLFMTLKHLRDDRKNR